MKQETQEKLMAAVGLIIILLVFALVLFGIPLLRPCL